MKKKNMLEYLENRLERELGDYDFAIDWQTKEHTVEVIIVLYAHNNQSVTVADLDGIESEGEIIEFEDAILLYPKGKRPEEEDTYLAMIPYEGKKGMTKGMIEAIAKYLYQVLEKGEDDLLTFLQDNTQEIFELYWDTQEFEQLVAESSDKINGEEYYSYPRY